MARLLSNITTGTAGIYDQGCSDVWPRVPVTCDQGCRDDCAQQLCYWATWHGAARWAYDM